MAAERRLEADKGTRCPPRASDGNLSGAPANYHYRPTATKRPPTLRSRTASGGTPDTLTPKRTTGNLHITSADQKECETMTPRTTTKMDLPFVIDEARQVYETEPVAAALMLYEGILALERSELPPETSAAMARSHPDLRTKRAANSVLDPESHGGRCKCRHGANARGVGHEHFGSPKHRTDDGKGA